MLVIEKIVATLYARERLVKAGHHNKPLTVADWMLSTKELGYEVEASNHTVLQKAHDLCHNWRPRGAVARSVDAPGPGYHWALTEEFYNRVGPAADKAFEILVAASGKQVTNWLLMRQLKAHGHAFNLDNFSAVAIELAGRPNQLVRWETYEDTFALDVNKWLKATAKAQAAAAGSARRSGENHGKATTA